MAFYGETNGKMLHQAGILAESHPAEINAVRDAMRLQSWWEDRRAYVRLAELLREWNL